MIILLSEISHFRQIASYQGFVLDPLAAKGRISATLMIIRNPGLLQRSGDDHIGELFIIHLQELLEHVFIVLAHARRRPFKPFRGLG